MPRKDPRATHSASSNTDLLAGRQRSILLLQRALMMFRGHSPFGYLGEIHRVAVEETGFEGSLEEAAELLAEIPQVRVELDPVLGQSRVYASAYWSPS